MGIKKVFVLLGLIFFVSCSPQFPDERTPIFKEGDCLKLGKEPEHPEIDDDLNGYYKILRVGKTRYLVDFRSNEEDKMQHLTDINILIQDAYTKVNCPANLR